MPSEMDPSSDALDRGSMEVVATMRYDDDDDCNDSEGGVFMEMEEKVQTLKRRQGGTKGTREALVTCTSMLACMHVCVCFEEYGSGCIVYCDVDMFA